MRLARLFIALIIFFLLQECSLFWSSNVPGWYNKKYSDSEYIYGRGQAKSQREELAVKKAETAAQSDLNVRVDYELGNIVSRAMRSNGIIKTDPGAKRFKDAKWKVLLKIKQISTIENKEIRHNNSLFRVFILLKLRKADLEELYLTTLRRN